MTNKGIFFLKKTNKGINQTLNVMLIQFINQNEEQNTVKPTQQYT